MTPLSLHLRLKVTCRPFSGVCTVPKTKEAQINPVNFCRLNLLLLQIGLLVALYLSLPASSIPLNLGV